jgi:hypothetical protein
LALASFGELAKAEQERGPLHAAMSRELDGFTPVAVPKD